MEKLDLGVRITLLQNCIHRNFQGMRGFPATARVSFSLTCLTVHQYTYHLRILIVVIYCLNSTEYCQLSHDCRRVRSHCRRDTTLGNSTCHRGTCLDCLQFSPTVVNLVHTVAVGGVNWALRICNLDTAKPITSN